MVNKEITPAQTRLGHIFLGRKLFFRVWPPSDRIWVEIYEDIKGIWDRAIDATLFISSRFLWERRSSGRYLFHFSIHSRKWVVTEESLAEVFGLGGNFLSFTNHTFQRMIATLVPRCTSSPYRHVTNRQGYPLDGLYCLYKGECWSPAILIIDIYSLVFCWKSKREIDQA